MAQSVKSLDSWFRLRLWSQGPEPEPRIRLPAQLGSLLLSLSPWPSPCPCMLSLCLYKINQSIFFKKKDKMAENQVLQKREETPRLPAFIKCMRAWVVLRLKTQRSVGNEECPVAEQQRGLGALERDGRWVAHAVEPEGCSSSDLAMNSRGWRGSVRPAHLPWLFSASAEWYSFINLDLHCPLGQPRTPCSSWALHTWHVTWLMRPTTDFLIVRNYHDVKFKLYMKIMFGFWKTFKYVQDNLGIWVYFSICIFCEI